MDNQMPSNEPVVRRTFQLSTFLPLVLLVVSVAINVLLGLQVRQLKKGALAEEQAAQLAMGSVVPSIPARDLDGNPVVISYDQTTLDTVLYFFTTECGWCARNLDNINHLAEQGESRYRVVGVSPEGNDKVREYLTQHNMNFAVYSTMSPSVESAYKLGGTPHTMVVSAEGKVLRNWFGAYSGSLQQEIEGYFDTHLPGLTTSAR